MTKAHLNSLAFVLIVLFACELIPGFDGFKWKKDYTNLCASHNNKLFSTLNILCNSTQTTSIQARDACYGCFFRAGTVNGGAMQLQALSQCATMYLVNTEYATCTALLQISGPVSLSTSGCNNGYCNFVRCVRRINANNLIDGCFRENLANRDITTSAGRVSLYTNVTSCILARARCSTYNPINGELQNQVSIKQYGHGFGGLISGFINQASLYNSLQVSASGDIRIISFPAPVSIADLFCTRSSSLEQSGYGNSVC